MRKVELDNNTIIYPFEDDESFMVTVTESGIVWTPQTGRAFTAKECWLFAASLMEAARIVEQNSER